MPGALQPITYREKAAIAAYLLGILPDIKTAWSIAENSSIEEAFKHKAVKNLVSRWHNSDKFKTFAAHVNGILQDREQDARMRGREEQKQIDEGKRPESEPTKNPGRAVVDYYDPDNQRKQINRIISEAAGDPKTQLDAIKAIQQTQRDDKQAAKDNQVQRVYIPLRCHSCPLYEKAQEKQRKKL